MLRIIVYISGERYEKQAYGVPIDLMKEIHYIHVCIKLSGLHLVNLGMSYHAHTHKGCSVSYFNLRVESFSLSSLFSYHTHVFNIISKVLMFVSLIF